jgi:hypothetical protein
MGAAPAARHLRTAATAEPLMRHAPPPDHPDRRPHRSQGDRARTALAATHRRRAWSRDTTVKRLDAIFTEHPGDAATEDDGDTGCAQSLARKSAPRRMLHLVIGLLAVPARLPARRVREVDVGSQAEVCGRAPLPGCWTPRADPGRKRGGESGTGTPDHPSAAEPRRGGGGLL